MARPKKDEAKNRSSAMGLRVEPWVKAGLDKLADDKGVPYSDVAHAALVAYLKRHGIREPR